MNIRACELANLKESFVHASLFFQPPQRIRTSQSRKRQQRFTPSLFLALFLPAAASQKPELF
ncbi:MAG: hypothetical protein C5B59_14985 [Bacteroidetes bacterium]|nr:MAG: hypothetical protein C5B59_14985 [Bacteroidota bacterium]